MPVKLLAHHLFTPSLPGTHFPSMNPIQPSTRVIPFSTRTFLHKLNKYQCLSSKLGSPVLLTHHHLGGRLVTRPRPSAVRASKGLLDDEAELGAWASGLSSDSVLTRDRDTGRGSNGGRGRNERGEGRNRVSSGKRLRENDSGRYEKSNGEMGRDSFGSLSRGKARVGDELKGRNGGFFVPKREEEVRGRRVSDSGGNERSPSREMGRESFRSNSRGSTRNEGFVSPRRENDWRRGSDSDDSGNLNRQMGRDAFGSSARNSRGNSRFGSRSEGDRRMSKSAVRGLEMGYGQNRGGGSGEFSNGGNISRKGGALITKEGRGDEEREGNFRKSLADLIFEADSEEEGEKDIDGDGDLFASAKESRLRTLPSSPETSDSYLSETRFYSEHS